MILKKLFKRFSVIVMAMGSMLSMSAVRAEYGLNMTEGVTPMAHPLNAMQRLRPDAVTEADERDRYQANAPATSAGLYLVPRVIE